jgi:hypothetical protein
VDLMGIFSREVKSRGREKREGEIEKKRKEKKKLRNV